jgi:hypothetical protein
LYVGQSGPMGLVMVGTGPLEVEVPVLEAEVEAEAELPPAGRDVVVAVVMLLEIVAVEDDGDATAVDLMVDTVLANTIWGPFIPATTMAASERSWPPAVTTPMVRLSLHWLLDADMSKVTATHTWVALPDPRALQAAIHSARLVPLVLVRSSPKSAVLQRTR